MSLFKKASIAFLSLFILSFIPFVTFAEEDPSLGTITINTRNQEGEAITGNWYLHQGGTINGSVIRNGLSGETFQVDPGSYYLEARKATGIYDFYDVYQITTENPQSVVAGGITTFNITYYETEEDMLNPIEEPAEEPAEEPVEEEVEEEVEEPATEEPATEEPAESESIIDQIIDYYTGDEETEAESVEDTESAESEAPYVPTFETPPETESGQAVAESESEEDLLATVSVLAATGPGALLLLIPSAIGGLLFASRRRK
ncbi:hypothetical protein KJ742_05195 [Patescibacteria group bacterium]|nr:hypothetical protein [Patescibacteria group bacterium]MBU1683315.1 hypothetical protein [Patescibacteria group bacterium]MBU1934468.1 hypothetical protein [Patescibacteria group bacterium]